MNIKPAQIITNNLFLKVSALIFGTLLWSFLADSFNTYKWINVPIYFYNKSNSVIIDAPDTIKVKLKGTKSALSTIDKENIAVHIDANKLTNRVTPYVINNEDLFLSPSIKLVDYLPHTINIKLNAS